MNFHNIKTFNIKVINISIDLLNKKTACPEFIEGPHRLMVRTQGSQLWNLGSIPGGVIWSRFTNIVCGSAPFYLHRMRTDGSLNDT